MTKYFLLLSPGRRPARRSFAILFFASSLRHETLALVQPHLDADLAVSRVRFGEPVIDVGAQRLQRQLAVQVPLGARDFGADQAARYTHLDAAGAEAQRRLDRLAHRAAEGDALFELHRLGLGNQLGVELRLLDLLDVDEDVAAGLLLDFLFQLVDFRALAADDDPRPGRVDVDLEPVDRALGLDLRDAGVREPLLQALAQREIFVEQLRVLAVRVPTRTPRLVETEAEPKRVNLLAHGYSFVSFCCCFFDGVVADFSARARFGRGASPLGVVPTAITRSARSDTCTVRCVVRFRTRKARPIGAGRTRLADGPWLA